MTYEDLSREQLIEALTELEDVADEWEERAKRVKADFENYKRRETDRKQKWTQETQKALAADLIQVLDNLERAIMAADEDSNLLTGVEMVADELYNLLNERGLQRIEPDGGTFDPRVHNAVGTQHHDKDNVILDVKRPGYRYEDYIIREADVVVGKQQDTGDSS